ncbi:MAG: hypothetical protein LBF82_00135 [Lactobacillales bacterium]|jgi:hypothetical protein|nr:hypothetical protein [Lactobacillales bacterium]
MKNSQHSILSSGQTKHDAKAFYALLSSEKFKLEHLIYSSLQKAWHKEE